MGKTQPVTSVIEVCAITIQPLALWKMQPSRVYLIRQCPHQDIQDLSLHVPVILLFTHIIPRMQPHHSEFGSAALDKEEPLLVALEGPIRGSLVFTLFPALGQNPVEQARGSVCLGLGGHRLRHRDLGPPHRDGALIFTLAPIQPTAAAAHSSSSASPSYSTSFAPPPECL